MKRLLSILLAALMVMSLGMTAVYAEDLADNVTLPFTDVKDSKWYADAVKYVYANGLMNGMTATTFAPEGELTRAQFAKMLWSLAGSPATEPNLKFADTKNNKWYSESLTWAVNAGIVNGYNEGGKLLFKPDNKITRDELAKMIVTFLEYMDVEIVGEDIAEGFTDAAKFQKWAVPFIEAVRLSGLMKGKDGGRFEPKANATRAEGATILMRMYPYLSGSTVDSVEKIAEDFINTYQCLHGDIHFICNYGRSMTNEAIAAALAKYMDLDSKGITVAVTDGQINTVGMGRGQAEGGTLTFTFTETESGATASFTTGVACHKYFDIGEDGDYIKYFCADPIYFVPVACHEDINDMQSAKVAAAGLENLPTEYSVNGFTYESIWKAIDAAINFEDKLYFETILNKAELDALIASASGGKATGEITVALDRLTKSGCGCGASVKINVTLVDDSQERLQTLTDTFLDTYQCLHGDIHFICGGSATMTNEAIAAALAKYMELDSKGITVEVTEGQINTVGMDRGQAECGNLTFTFTDTASGATSSFTTGVACHKYLNAGVRGDYIMCFQPNPIYFVPVACHEDINDMKSAQVAAAGLENIPTEYEVSDFSYESIWKAIDAGINFEDKLYFETILVKAELDALIEGAVDGVATGEITVKLDRMTKADRGCGASVKINVTITEKVAAVANDFIDTYQCLHGDIHLICGGGSTMENGAIAAAVAKFLELDSKGMTLAVTAGEINKTGCGRGQSEGGHLTFTLTDTASGATASFDTGVTCHKYYDIGTEGDYYKHFQPDPIYFVPVACHEDIKDSESAATAEAGLANLPTEYTVSALSERAIWEAIDAAINFEDKLYFETMLLKSDVDALIANAVDGVATGTLTVAIDRMTKPGRGCGASVTLNVTITDPATAKVAAVANDFIDTYQCLHGDIHLICGGGSTMENGAIAAAVAKFLELDSKGMTLAVTAGEINKTGCGRGQSEGGNLTFTLTDTETGASVSFTTGVTCHKYYDIGEEGDYYKHFAPDPIYFVPVACHEDIKDSESAATAEAGLANLPTEYTVSALSERAIWEAIDAAIDFEDKLYFETMLLKSDVDALIANAVDGVATGTLTVAIDRMTKPGRGCGASVQIEVTVSTATNN